MSSCQHVGTAKDPLQAVKVASPKLEIALRTGKSKTKDKAKGSRAKRGAAGGDTPQWVCLCCGDLTYGEGPEDPDALRHFSKKHPVAIGVAECLPRCMQCEDLIPLDALDPRAKERMTAAAEAFSLIVHPKAKGKAAAEKRPKEGQAEAEGEDEDTEANASARSSAPPLITLSTAVPKGLHNLGNTCFMNSVLQNLVETTPLLDYMKAQAASLEETQSDMPLSTHMSRFLRAMTEAKATLKEEAESFVSGPGRRRKAKQQQQSTSSCISPSAIFSEVARLNPIFRGNRQQDAHELLRLVVDRLNEEILEAQKKRVRSQSLAKVSKWDSSRFLVWLDSLGLRECEAIKSNLAASTRGPGTEGSGSGSGSEPAMDGAMLVAMINAWDSKAAVRMRKRFGFRLLEDKQAFTRGVRALLHGESPLLRDAEPSRGEREGEEGMGGGEGERKASASSLQLADGIKALTPVHEIFSGVLENTVECLHCNTVSTSHEVFFDLSLPIQPPRETKAEDWAAATPRRGPAANRKQLSSRQRKNQKRAAKRKGKHDVGGMGGGRRRINAVVHRTLVQQRRGGKKQSQREEEQEEEEEADQGEEEEGEKPEPQDDGKKGGAEEAEAEAESAASGACEAEPGHAAAVAGTVPSAATEGAAGCVGPSSRSSAAIAGPGPKRLVGECSVADCLFAFTDPDILTGANSYGCAACTERAKEEALADAGLAMGKSRNGTGNGNGSNVGEHCGSGNGEGRELEDKLAALSLEAEGKEREEEGEREGDMKEEVPTEDGGAGKEARADDGGDAKGQSADGEGDVDGFGISDVRVPLVKRTARKRFLIARPPRVLTLHLKRFQQVGSRLEKVSKHVDFPLLLDLAPFCTAANAGTEPSEPKREAIWYRLYGVAVHSGGMGGGHYVAYTCKARPTTPTTEHATHGHWHYFSDSHFQEATCADVLRQQAYLLFYERCTQQQAQEEQGAAAEE